jgi:hypothetical protein
VHAHVFDGDIEAYAKATGFTAHWLLHLLYSNARMRISAFARFVESGVVAAEWLFCGSGPMLQTGSRHNDLAGYIPPVPINSQYAFFDSTLGQPGAFAFPARGLPDAPASPHAAFVPLAKAIFAARSNNKAVTLFLNADVVRAGVGPLVIEMLKQKYVTSLAMTSDAALADIMAAYKDQPGAFTLIEPLKLAASAGVGFGEAFGQWGLSAAPERKTSIIANAYDLGVPITVHALIGEAALHAYPAVGGAELGSVLGATSYVDLLVFIAQVHQMAGNPPGVFIVAGANYPALQLLSVAIDAGQRLPTCLDFDALVIARLTPNTRLKSAAYTIAGDYAWSFSSLTSTCRSIYEGVDYVGTKDGANAAGSSCAASGGSG